MIASIHRRSIALLPGLPLAVLGCLAINSCGSSKKNSQSGSPYASYPSDGHYNPYPTGSQGSVPRYQEYTEAPPPPPEPKPKSKPTVASKTSSSSSKKSAAKKSAATSRTASSKSGTVHVVKRGDSLYSLARKYHSTISKIKSANGLKSDLIRDGQKLRIP